jgi:hypothetical protein
MGGRRGGSRQELLGKGRGGRGGGGRGSGGGGGGGGGGSVGKKLEQEGSKAVAVAAFAAAAQAVPVVGILFAAYQVATYTYPIAREGVMEYSRTGDSDRAVQAMAKETVRQTGKAVVDATVSSVAGAATHGALGAAGIKADKTATTFVQAAVTQVIGDAMS